MRSEEEIWERYQKLYDRFQTASGDQWHRISGRLNELEWVLRMHEKQFNNKEE